MVRPRVPLISLAFALLLLSAGADACTCGRGTFMDGVPRARLIVHAKVERHIRPWREVFLAMDLAIHQVIHGAHLAPELRVWGDIGLYCRPYVNQFPVGSEWVFALTREHNQWIISNCDENWLRVDNGLVTGRIESDAVRELALTELVAWLKARTPLIEIQKYDTSRHTPYGYPYSLKLWKDGTVTYEGVYYVYVLDRDAFLPPLELESLLRFLEEGEFSKLAALPPFGDAAYTAAARITVVRDSKQQVWVVNPRSDSQMALFQDLERRLKVESMRCPFVILVHEEVKDACVILGDYYRKFHKKTDK